MTERWRNIKRAVVPLRASLFLACTPARPGNIQPSPDRLPSPTPIPTRVEPTAVPTPVPFKPIIPTPTPGREQAPSIPSSPQDNINRRLTTESKVDETLALRNVLIGNIFRVPWEGGEAYITVVDALNQNNRPEMVGLILSSNCIFDRLRERNDLGSSFLSLLGAWTPNQRIDNLQVEVLASSSLTNPAILNAKRLSDGGVDRNCVEVTALQRLKEQISRVSWNELPKDIGRLAGWIGAELLRGIREGIASGTPTATPPPTPTQQGFFPNLPRLPFRR
ncbi:hypothetical protein A3B45_04785 [Candidatus Daviesbacteria bacterium RIFCSPLOWO2_01_FULL_39_12]|uniref:Uncharacterized protein n=1 Tax=Candidatus Daviesbacteria bacterium RIFCSPLOWO2_01_FULL_39_12 TaxID=1797785 RepID=A0A1F5KM32_9BACT|nr:MAG: hypothetical protein A3D79_01210 [Candidatus Daviesbacteria bacterium RIFCSPHIGHO2_02_FULL_39_8]OGE41671.1 MAG: hypothetical protein A3B45_04785 [Candidatus Daviesbacteria bacterium RIFCSPLOWO2_01_FULL_39_12]